MICGNGISTRATTGTFIGENTVFYHHGAGCVVHENAIIGENCRIFGNVTIGARWSLNRNDPHLPVIGDNVLIGAGAVVLGNVKIGNNAIIGANAVMTQDVPPDALAVGVPAVIKRKEFTE